MQSSQSLPKHIAIIMDGNGRWARQKGLARTAGHREGAESVRDIVKTCSELGIRVLTLYAFSVENWNRPKGEINLLMRYFAHFLDKELPDLEKNNIRLMVIGRIDALSKDLQKKIKNTQDKTSKNSGMTLVLALNYGARQEIVDALKRILKDVEDKVLKPEQLDENNFSNYLYTAGLPEPDLLIRTSGEMRISNFLLWQLSYAEFYFPKKCWPDFRRADLEEAIGEFQKRERRFGGV